MLERLIYRSRALAPAPTLALEAILPVSRWKNARLEITGALGFTGMHYVQLLEGPGDALDGLMATLAADARHTRLDVLYRVETQSRVAPGWSMARADLNDHSSQAARLIDQGDGLALTTLLATLVATGETVVS